MIETADTDYEADYEPIFWAICLDIPKNDYLTIKMFGFYV